jgi:hypothetical protein
MKHWLKKWKYMDRHLLYRYAFGYYLLGFFTIMMGAAINQNRQVAAFNCLTFAAALMYFLPPEGQFSWKHPKTWAPLARFTIYLLLGIALNFLVVYIVLNYIV